MELFHSGWLQRALMKGETFKSKKSGWCILQGGFASFYAEAPGEGKEAVMLSEILYLADATVGDIQMDTGSAICLTLKTGRKFLLTVPPSDHEETDYQCWRSAFGYAVSKAKSLENDGLNIWCMKKGGAGHVSRNWKKRMLLLQGNFLFYYGDQPKAGSLVDNLKGRIDLSDLSEVTMDDKNCDKPFNLRLSKKNDKEYFLVFPNEDEQMRWNNCIKKQQGNILAAYSVLPFAVEPERVIRFSSFQKRVQEGPWKKFFCVMTNLHIRIYKTRKSEADMKDLAKGQLSRVLLLGSCITSEERKEKEKDICNFTIVDVWGVSHEFQTDDRSVWDTWVYIMRKMARDYNINLLKNNGGIFTSCPFATLDGAPLGYADIMTTKALMAINVRPNGELRKIPHSRIVEKEATGDEFKMQFRDDQDQVHTFVMKTKKSSATLLALQCVQEHLQRIKDNEFNKARGNAGQPKFAKK